MGRINLRGLLLLAAFLCGVAGIAGGVWWLGYRAALAPLAQRAQGDLRLASDTLTAELRRLRELAVLTADHPQVRAVLEGRALAAELRPVLQEIADKSGALEMRLVSAGGATLAATSDARAMDHAGLSHFERAMDGALGAAPFHDPAWGPRAFAFAAPVFDAAGPVTGALVLYADVEGVEATWRGAMPSLFFSDAGGEVFLTNRSELVFQRRDPVPEAGAPAALLAHGERFFDGYEIWDVPGGGRYLPREALHLSRALPGIGLTGEVLVDTSPARQVAGLQAAVAASLSLVVGALSWLAGQRRRTLAMLNRKLERRVEARTAELRALNTDLRREVAERIAAEARLKKAQADLVQAGKLSALGKMSAGISHELNQPLTAIRSFAENAQSFLDRDRPEIAAQNLQRISELARRMGRIIRNLRAFARQEAEPPKTVDAAAAIEAALEMAQPRATEAEAALHWQAPPGPVLVRAGEVRLQQVVLNLLGNAIDAMDGAERREVFVTLVEGAARSVITIRDTGPGIAEPERIFDPFYSTKPVGAEEGMGLGLSISYGLVQSFGGEIRGRNHPDGGAVFTVELMRAEPAREVA